jgi:uncharacterized delta-60 repeat protein
MKRKKAKTKAPQILLVGWDAPVRAAVMVAGLASGTALAAPGDLDPSFGDVGRKSGITYSWFESLRSVEVQDDDSVIFGGGGEYAYYDWFEDFFGRLLPDGTPDTGFLPATLDKVALYDTALQSDGKLVGVGLVRQPDNRQKLALFRLLPGGALDASFGLNGLMVISDGTTSHEAGFSVIVEPDGRIVVAGYRGNDLLVVRTLPNGTLDASFGSGGAFTGPEILYGTPRIASAPGGGYRLIASTAAGGMGWGCQVVGLTASGALDVSFDSDGYAYPPSGTNGIAECTALAVQPDGHTVVVGRDSDNEIFIDRLLANGTRDPAFATSVAASRFRWVTALGLGSSGKVFVAGRDQTGFSGALVARLLADGALDAGYGQSGTTFVDPRVRLGQDAWISDLKVASDDGLVVGGNYYSWAKGNEGFVARVRGDGVGGSPGVFSITQQRVLGTEAGGTAVLKVRRTGGSSGAVAVTYTTSGFPWTFADGGTYTPGISAGANDFTASTGRLTWADGDAGEREIVVPIATDTAVEQPEWFGVELSVPEGGAGLGFYGAAVEIAGDSYPYGDINIFSGSATVREGETTGFNVSRDYYSQGAVTVTVRVASGSTATAGDDFRNSGSTWQDVVLSWADGEAGSKYVPVTIVADGVAESAETLTLELVSLTGGALVGALPQATVQISSQVSPPTSNPPPTPAKRGGGSFGWLGALLLGLAGVFRHRSVPRLQAARRRA